MNSDLDLILIVKHSDLPFWRCALEWDILGLPMPVDLLVYTQEEWQSLVEGGERFPQTVEKEPVWVY